MPMKPSRLVAGLGGALAFCGCAAAAGAVVWQLTAGLTLFTSESWRRAAVVAAPVALPRVVLQDEAGQVLQLDELCTGRVMVIDFIYTQCPTVCRSLGVTSSQLARRLAPQGGPEDVIVMSLSFDPQRDTPDRLRAFKQALEPTPTGWRLARPVNDWGRKKLMDAFGVVVIPDGMGGYDHNAALHVVDARCRLVRVLDADGVGPAEAVARQLLGREGT